jgi:nucleotide-binding universal stress UspA family protein
MPLAHESKAKNGRNAPAGPGKVGFSVMALDMLLSIAILLLGIYMLCLFIFNGIWIMLLPSLLFMGIGFLKVRKLLPILSASIGMNKDTEIVTHRNILVPLSRPETVESLVNIGCDLLSKGGTIRLLNVIEIPQQLPYEYADTKKASARSLLTKAAEYAQKRGITPKLEIVSSRDTHDAIIDLARRYQCDLIVMGSSQRTVPEKVLFGNVVDSILREAPCEVVVFSYSARLQPIRYDRILVPTSGYKHAQRALDIAVQFEKKFGGKISSMYVGQESDAEKASIILKKAKMHAEKYGVTCDTVFRTGSVADNIVKEAKEGNYTLIIIGSTERPSYYTFLLGSVADEIVTKAPCNVLVVRTKG